MSTTPAKVEETNSPIFVHSLFRAGSTYLFQVFRRSEYGYWCYQEPLHEISFLSKEDKERLLVGFEPDVAVVNRHPRLDRPYFQELYEVADVCLPALERAYIYDAYFAEDPKRAGVPYWEALIGAARGRPLIQECRTASRIGVLKQALGGTHVYLWRNPWDQWWSCRINDYFPAALQLIINSGSPLPVISRLRAEIGFVTDDSVDLALLLEHFKHHPLSAEDGYFVFYALWCLGLDQGVAHADLLLNIDFLATQPEYRIEVEQDLLARQIGGLSFSDCSVPLGSYGEKDRQFFGRIEDRVYGLLLSSGMSRERLERIIAIRYQFSMDQDEVPLPGWDSSRDAERVRAIVRDQDRLLASQASLITLKNGAYEEVAAQLSAARAELGAANDLASKAEQAMSNLQQQLKEVGAANHHHWAMAEERARHIEHLLAELNRLGQDVRSGHALSERQSALVDRTLRETQGLQDRIAKDQHQLREEQARYQRAADLLSERNGQIARLEEDLQAAGSENQRLSIELAKQSAANADAISRLQAQLTEHASQITGEAQQAKAEIARLKLELDSVHQANHYHWQLSKEKERHLLAVTEHTSHIAGEAAQAKAEIADLKLELDSVHQANHYHWQLSKEKERHLLSVFGSRSWRVTAPLRETSRLLRAGFHKQDLLANPLGHAMNYVAARPRLKKFAERVIRWFPKADAKLRGRRAAQLQAAVTARWMEHGKIADTTMNSEVEETSSESFVGFSEDQKRISSSLSPRARQIFEALIAKKRNVGEVRR
jgi:hypothetical protein